MVSSISNHTQSLAYEMAQVGASSSLSSSSKIERLNYNGLSESEQESLRQKYSSALEEYNLDDLDLYEEIEGFEEAEESYLEQEFSGRLNYSDAKNESSSSQDEISYYANKYAQISDEVAISNVQLNSNLSGYSKFNYNKINSAYAPRITYSQSNIKVYA